MEGHSDATDQAEFYNEDFLQHNGISTTNIQYVLDE